ncbi:MAG: ABC transporter permease, partial [Erysipelotrichaceae bacterium]|nr:ABC transporter permease [Erysipelotrichaceae bacterium]
MKAFRRLAVPYIIWSALMLLLPMLLILFYSLIKPGNEFVSFQFTLSNYVKFFTDKDFLLILW